MKPYTITVNDRMQKKYTYARIHPPGKNFHPGFNPDLSPKEMLALGIFGGKYLNDCKKEFPKSWFTSAKLSETKSDPSLNYFKIQASKPLSYWRQKGWIYTDDPRGWFQWYCRYYMGRRIEEEDLRQIKRWRMMVRHVAQIKHNCMSGDFSCRKRQRQALLQWGYDMRHV